ncbi:MAG: hypothetical protein QG607_270 [Patescibacteria group bacterium]|jgi:hypothetical protein|nr:hypothetical protein [Patescibacteria group bacterium]
MSFFSKLFGGTSAPPVPVNPADEVKRQIETAEGELRDAEAQLSATADPEIKTSLEFLVTRKTQALKDLQDKLTSLTK